MGNSSSVYGTIRPLSGNVSDFINNQERMDFFARQEKRQLQEIEEGKKAKEQERIDALRKKMLGQLPKNYDTGSSSLNEFQAKLIQKGVNRIGEIYQQLNNPNTTEEERIKLEIEAQNLQNLPNNLKIATDKFSSIIKDYNEGVEKGIYFREPNFEKKVLSGFDNYVGDLDNGLPVVGFLDRNNDGTINGLDVVDYNQIQNGIGNWSFQKQYDLDALAKSTGEKLGTEEIQTDRNFVKTTTKQPKIAALEELTNNLMVNQDGSPKDVTLSELRKRGLSVTPENIEKVKTIFKENVLAYTDKSTKQDVDYSAQTSRMSENRKAKKEEITRISSQIDGQMLVDDILPENTRGKILDKNMFYPNIVTIPDNKLTFRNLGGENSRINNGFVTAFMLEKDGDIIVHGKALLDKGQKFKVGGSDLNFSQLQDAAESGNEEAVAVLDSYSSPANYGRFTRKVSGAELSGLARMAGYNSVSQLKGELKKLNENKQETPEERIARLKRSQGLK